MRQRLWYGLNRETNPVGFGCWQISGNYSFNGLPQGWGHVSEKEGLDLLTEALYSGFEFFDTAQGYNDGKSEELLGRAIGITKLNPVVCSKIPITENEIRNDKLDIDFCENVEGCLRRLKKDSLDILLIH